MTRVLRSADRPIWIVGAGSLGRMVLSALVDMQEPAADDPPIAFVDDRETDAVHGFPVLGTIDALLGSNDGSDVDVILAIAHNSRRREVVATYPDLAYPSIAHPSAVVSEFASVGRGCIVLPNVSCDPDAIIGDFVVLNKNVTVGHNASLADFSQVGPGGLLGGPVGVGTFIGMGAIVLPHVSVGDWSTIGAGSVVVHDIPAGVTAYGSPCRVKTVGGPME